MNPTRLACLLAGCLASVPGWAQTIGGGTCSASNLNGTYSLTLNGRGISSTGTFTGSLQAEGIATFDGVSKVTFTGTSNTNLATGKAFSYTGSYTVPANCYGTLTLSQGSSAAFALVVYNSDDSFSITGSDATYVYSGTGSNTLPHCATPTLSGQFIFDATGFTESGTTQNGVADEGGTLQFDGQGNVTATYVMTSAGTVGVPLTATGTYAVTSDCQATATLTDSLGKSNSINFVITGAYGQNAGLIAANSQFVRTGTAHAVFTNPTQSIGNAFSYAVNSVPPGSAFVLFGQNLVTREIQPLTLPFPPSLLNTTVTVNGEAVPLYYADPGQINAQMPWDIQGNTVATVIVKNGAATSNAAAVYIPATGTPGIALISTTRAAVVNGDGAINSGAAPAPVGDEVAVYFTGGGPVNASGKLTSGAGAPAGLSPVTGTNSVTVGGVNAVVKYMGLSPGNVGLYQANFIVPQLSAGAYPVIVTIAGQASNNPVMNVK